MSVFLKGCTFEHTELSINFQTFNDVCAIVKEAEDANLLSQESKLMHVNLQLNLCLSKSTTPVLKGILNTLYNLIYFQYLKVNLQP